ncbi:RraA family protein (plasmid) [Rhizobium leguminosarum]|jgi:regulator of RNase E activity RraA|uniref:Putative 4-hydroxy-4-methyl-2-oxoglutarate aldolase n=1 Tax=Rhizobium leguminosarum TaxID=384 RepID=A0A7M3DKL2_RHILE|nr:RraA family protein [Rhizobium leguminosarum]TAY43086.1 RraA family protein [Rhizobium leguminosarum]TBZ41301.1 RraA family protein [Rhizobium leguminosarum bv. viciae]TCA09441.1 RraA family protein [Rhizobium leguminosarum bv. viciae]TCA18846.1 RraA family protein [Rhizobium leguminosarum bv. viciae]
MTAFYRMVDRSPPLPDDLIERLSLVDTATIGHVEHLGFVGDNIRPVFPARVAGAALTVAAPGRDGVIVYRAIDLLLPGDILVISRVDRDDIACVGGGVAAAAKAKGVAGIVIDGPCTDVEEIIAAGVPVWCRGVSAKTTNRQFQIGGSLNVPIACGAAAVLPGFAVLADNEGVFVADRDRMGILAKSALERQKRSVAVRSHLASGRSIFEFRQEPTS